MLLVLKEEGLLKVAWRVGDGSVCFNNFGAVVVDELVL